MHPAWESGEDLSIDTTKRISGEQEITSLEEYAEARDALLKREAQRAFDWDVHANASELEIVAAKIVAGLRFEDVAIYYKRERDNHGHRRTPAGHFLGNVDIINKTTLMQIAKKLPKGAHLHCHYNSCLPPSFLIQHARNVPTMWIKSSYSLASEEGKRNAEIQFQVQQEQDVQAPTFSVGNLMQDDYVAWSWQRYSDFRKAFGGDEAAEAWLCKKMLLTEDEVHGVLQTVKDIWLRFDICTRMMKGLFGYESAFRAYTKACIQDFIKDGIQYAEVRPNFPSNVLRSDAGGITVLKTSDGREMVGNRAMMQIIVDEVEIQMKANSFFKGLKVIYCCPRSFSNAKIKESMEECLALHDEFPTLICGYDLVGSEDRGRPLKDFLPEFLWFQQECKRRNVCIPFLFHAGETLDTGTSTDQNLLDAVLLNSKRIGHGFALTKHPEVLDMVKEKNICLELCPISNEILHLTSTIKGHALSDLLARNVHCTVNSDNGTFYSSTLSHDFYQVMIGSDSMDLLGWKQLALWSLDHSMMSPTEKSSGKQFWEAEWLKFCGWIVETYDKWLSSEEDAVGSEFWGSGH